MDRTRRGLLALLLLTCATSAAPGDEKPDTAALAHAARSTRERLAKQPASWAADLALPGGGRIVVDVLQAPGRRRLTLSIALDDRRIPMIRIVERDGAWYVTDSGLRGKYRPFEAPTRLPLTYLYLLKADLLLADGRDLGAFERAGGPIVTYRSPLPEGQRRRLEMAVRGLENVARKGSLTAESKRTLENSKRLLSEGVSVEVDTESAIVVAHGAPERRVKITGFRWLDRADDGAFDVAGNWPDFTADPTAGDRGNLVLIGHNGLWQPGTSAGETDLRLLDVATGGFRRVPFLGANAVGGCFLSERTSVAVTGMDPAAGRMGLYEVDLKTGANRPIAAAALGGGMTLFPALSPDGKTLAVVHNPMTGLRSTIYLIDVKADTARPLGEPDDVAFPSWLPDGKGLLLVVRRPADNALHYRSSLARMDLDGRVTLLRDGTMPALIGDRKMVLYLDDSSRAWRTCRLDGGDDKPYADGLPGHAFPAPSPDGRRLVMMRVATGKAPVPVLLKLGETEGRPVTDAPGLWARPAWR